jgi:uncharacterized membrane protein
VSAYREIRQSIERLDWKDREAVYDATRQGKRVRPELASLTASWAAEAYKRMKLVITATVGVVCVFLGALFGAVQARSAKPNYLSVWATVLSVCFAGLLFVWFGGRPLRRAHKLNRTGI